VISNSGTQTSGSLVTFTGRAGQPVLTATGNVALTGKLTASLKSTFSAGLTDGTATLAAGSLSAVQNIEMVRRRCC